MANEEFVQRAAQLALDDAREELVQTHEALGRYNRFQDETAGAKFSPLTFKRNRNMMRWREPTTNNRVTPLANYQPLPAIIFLKELPAGIAR